MVWKPCRLVQGHALVHTDNDNSKATVTVDISFHGWWDILLDNSIRVNKYYISEIFSLIIFNVLQEFFFRDDQIYIKIKISNVKENFFFL